MTEVSIKLAPNDLRDNIYYPGQILYGTVELFLDTAKEINGFYILITGQAKCGWFEGNKKVQYRGSQILLKSKHYFIGNEGKKSTKVKAGNHVFSFACKLPLSLPESFKIYSNTIEYNIEAVFDISWIFDKKICVPFTIKRNDTLNDYPKLMQPMQLENKNSFCCFCYTKGKCTIIASIPQRAFAVGQMIPVNFECENLSAVDINNVTVQLIQETSLTSETPNIKTKKLPSKTLNTVRLNGVKSGNFLKNREILIQIPLNSHQSNERFCRVVTIKHILEVRGNTSWYHGDLLVQFPITIV